MSTKGKEYQLAIRIAGKVDKTFYSSLATANSQLRTQITNLNTQFTKMDQGYNKIMNVGKTAFKAIATAAAVAATAVGAAMVASINAGREFETAFAGVKKTVEATAEEYASLRQDILDMSMEIPSSAVEIAGVMEVAGQLGIATENLTEFTKTMINLGVSTNMTADEAATALAKFANITQMDPANYENLGSVIVDLGNNFATTEADIVTMATNLASTGELVGLTEAQILALSTAMSSVGIASERGGSTMSKLLKKMQLAVELNSDSLQDYASVAGMTGEQFKETFQKDAVVALSAFIDGLDDTERNGKSAIVILDEMGLNEVRLSNTILALANSGDLMSDAIKTANEAWDENTALSIEAGKRYETTDSKLQILKNSFFDLGVAAYDELEEPFRNALDWMTDNVQDFTEYVSGPNGISKWVRNVQEALPTVINNVKQFGNTTKKFLTPLFNMAKWFFKHPNVLATVFVSLGVALATYKIASTLVHIVNAISLLTANPVVLGILGVAAAIGAIASITHIAKEQFKKLVKENLAKHFGDIALSLDDIEEVASAIIHNKTIDKLGDMIDAFDELGDIEDSIDEAVRTLNKLNWKVSIGMELSEDDMTSYKEAITSYIENMQSYVLQDRYALTLAVDVLGGLESSGIKDQLDSFYTSKYNEMSELGTELNQVITDAFTDGLLDIDEVKEITELQNQMAAIKNAMASSSFDVALQSLGIEYSGAALDSDTYAALQTELADKVNEATAQYKEARDQLLQSALMMYNDPTSNMSKEDYDSMVSDIWQGYLDQVTEIQTKAYDFGYNTIMDTYGSTIDGAASSMGNEVSELINKYLDVDFIKSFMGKPHDQWTYEDQETFNAYVDEVWNNILESLYSMDYMDADTTAAIESLMKLLKPTEEQLQELADEYTALGLEIPKSIQDALTNSDTINSLSDDSNVYWAAVNLAFSNNPEYQNLLSVLQEYGYEIPQSLSDAITGNQDVVNESVRDLIANAQAQADKNPINFRVGIMSKAMGVDPSDPLGLFSGSNNSLLNIPGHASGGIFDIPHIAAFAERGPEAAIPIDGSSNAISLWERTGQLLGMGSALDGLDISGGSETRVEYSPVLNFYGDSPSQSDIESAMETSQDKFDAMMARYIKDHGRFAF